MNKKIFKNEQAVEGIGPLVQSKTWVIQIIKKIIFIVNYSDSFYLVICLVFRFSEIKVLIKSVSFYHGSIKK